ncbi:hypothetical protein AVEN_216495-1 [Araneus ventricosus]|uniref:Uncharacterized protein n=1 Tax=Araneus ventricosus TaxID=182803 RepID=A0A4Y2BM55_ARAVE|nr:hypothetical protein AVEN_216495-1 [Araneus ventricosus]
MGADWEATFMATLQASRRDQNRRDLTLSTTVPYPKSVIVWMGISANGVTKPRFVQPRAKINSEHYIQKILKPFLKDADCTQIVMLFSIRILPHRMHLGHPEIPHGSASAIPEAATLDAKHS